MLICRKFTLLSVLTLVFLGLPVVVLAGAEDSKPNEVSFLVTDSSAYTYHTTDDMGRETATLYFKVAFDEAQSGYLQGATIKLEYDPDYVSLDPEGIRPAAGWGSVNPNPIIIPGNPTTITYIIDPVPGESIIEISQAATTLAEFDFHVECQEVPQSTPINVVYSAAETWVDDGTDIHYVTDPGRIDHGSVNRWAPYFAVWLAEGDTDRDYEGALGAVIEVPVFLSGPFRVASADMTFSYDISKLEFVGLTGWDWYFTDSTTSFPITGQVRVELATDEAIHPRHRFWSDIAVNLCFRVLGDWQGGSTSIDFVGLPVFGIAQDAGTCETPFSNWGVYGGTIRIPQYVASYSTELLDGHFSLFDDIAEVQISLTNNFPAGLDQDSIIVNLNMGTDLEAKWITGETIDFGMFTFGGGPVDPQEVSLRRYLNPGFMDISSVAQPMVSFRMDKSENFTVPTAFDDRFVGFSYMTDFDGYPQFSARVVDTTGQVNLCEGAGLTWDEPDLIEFLMGEYHCPSVQGGNSNITQNYRTRTSFTMDDFRVKIVVSGPHHMWDITTIAEVEVESFDDVSYKWAILRSVPTGSFEQGPTEVPINFASITYTRNSGSNLAAKETPGDPDGPGGPPSGYWVTKTSTVSFEYEDPYYMKETGTGLAHYVVAIGGNVVSKWWVDGNPHHALFGLQLPEDFELLQNYPNPFNPATEIGFGLPTACRVELVIYNIAGQLVETLVAEQMPAGWHSVTWEGAGFASGIYLYRLQAGDYVESQKMVLLK